MVKNIVGLASVLLIAAAPAFAQELGQADPILQSEMSTKKTCEIIKQGCLALCEKSPIFQSACKKKCEANYKKCKEKVEKPKKNDELGALFDSEDGGEGDF